MKKPALLFVLAAFLTPVAASAQALDVVDRYMAAWNNHNAPAAADFLDENVEYYDAATGSPVKGRLNAQTNIIESFMKSAPNLRWTRDAAMTVATADKVAFRWTFSGRWADDVKAVKKDFQISGATLIRIKRGKIVFQGDYYDSKQLGLE